jgi:predicted nucleotidyltransferase
VGSPVEDVEMNRSMENVKNALVRNHDRIRLLGVRRIGVFGSVARNEAHAKSDVDFLVEFEEGYKTFDNFMDLSFLLEDELDRKIDLVTLESLSDNLKAHIIPEVEYFEIRP